MSTIGLDFGYVSGIFTVPSRSFLAEGISELAAGDASSVTINDAKPFDDLFRGNLRFETFSGMKES
jgi:hypothetical protein